MWQIVIPGFPSKEEAEMWMNQKVKRQDWHGAHVEMIPEAAEGESKSGQTRTPPSRK